VIPSLVPGAAYAWHVIVITEHDSLRCPGDSADDFSFTTINTPATITSFADRSVSINDQVRFTVDATDAEGIREYLWTIEGDQQSPRTTGQNSLTFAASGHTGAYVVTVAVIDSFGGVSKDTAHLAVTNEAPAILLPTDSIRAGFNDSVALSAAASDDGSLLTWEWDVKGNGYYIAVTSPDTTIIAPRDTEQKRYTLRVRVTDDDGNQSTDSLVMTTGMILEFINGSQHFYGIESRLVADSSYIYAIGSDGLSQQYDGVWRSGDGLTWDQIALNGGWDGGGFAALVHKNALYVLGSYFGSGVFKSTNHGSSWEQTGAMDCLTGPTAFAAAISARDTIFYIGGRDVTDMPVSGTVVSYDGIDWMCTCNDEEGMFREDMSAINIGDTLLLTIPHTSSIWQNYRSENGCYQWDYRAYDAFDSELTGWGKGDFVTMNGVLYYSANGHIWYSLDGAHTWRLMAESAYGPNTTTVSAAVHKNSIYIATEDGIWYTTDTP
jgi:hypothetical protein